jgi:hypothetical protein
MICVGDNLNLEKNLSCTKVAKDDKGSVIKVDLKFKSKGLSLIFVMDGVTNPITT